MKIKLSLKDIDIVFDHLDSDRDGTISYSEFCEFKKRNNFDKEMGLNSHSLKIL